MVAILPEDEQQAIETDGVGRWSTENCCSMQSLYETLLEEAHSKKFAGHLQ